MEMLFDMDGKCNPAVALISISPCEGNFIPDITLQPTWLEDEEEHLEGEEKNHFLSFIRKMLQWKPEDRKSPKELINDPWLRYQLHEYQSRPFSHFNT